MAAAPQPPKCSSVSGPEQWRAANQRTRARRRRSPHSHPVLLALWRTAASAWSAGALAGSVRIWNNKVSVVAGFRNAPFVNSNASTAFTFYRLDVTLYSSGGPLTPPIAGLLGERGGGLGTLSQWGGGLGRARATLILVWSNPSSPTPSVQAPRMSPPPAASSCRAPAQARAPTPLSPPSILPPSAHRHQQAGWQALSGILDARTPSPPSTACPPPLPTHCMTLQLPRLQAACGLPILPPPPPTPSHAPPSPPLPPTHPDPLLCPLAQLHPTVPASGPFLPPPHLMLHSWSPTSSPSPPTQRHPTHSTSAPPTCMHSFSCQPSGPVALNRFRHG